MCKGECISNYYKKKKNVVRNQLNADGNVSQKEFRWNLTEKQQAPNGCRLDNGAFEKEYLSIGNPSETNSKCVVSG